MTTTAASTTTAMPPPEFTAVLARSKDYELLAVKYDPMYDKVLAAIDIVKKFIVSKGLIIYGGTAIDYALRLHGDKIYPDDMLTIPDLDFYSPNSVEDAYELADILYEEGYTDARAICALHVETMRVDVGGNHFVADISYRPREIFDHLPYLVYDSMRVLHPNYQRIDVHSSLAFPYDNAPSEVILERWEKDIKRFNKLVAMYPLTLATTSGAAPEEFHFADITLPIPQGFESAPLCGLAAYSAIYHQYTTAMSALDAMNKDTTTTAAAAASTNIMDTLVTPRDIIPAVFSVRTLASGRREVTYSTFDTGAQQGLELISHHSPQKIAQLLRKEYSQGSRIKGYYPYANLQYARVEAWPASETQAPIMIMSTKNKLMGVRNVNVADIDVPVCGVQFMLKYLLAMYFIIGAPVCLALYTSILAMIETVTGRASTLSAAGATELPPSVTFFWPSIEIYGSANVNLAQMVALDRVKQAIADEPPTMKVPVNYYPDRGGDWPTFDYSSSPIFYMLEEPMPFSD